MQATDTQATDTQATDTHATGVPDIDPGFLDHLLDGLVATMPGEPATSEARRAVARMLLLAMRPADPVAAMLAVQAIAAHYAAMDAFRRAAQETADDKAAARMRASAAALGRMMRAGVKAADARREPAVGPETGEPAVGPEAREPAIAEPPRTKSARPSAGARAGAARAPDAIVSYVEEADATLEGEPHASMPLHAPDPPFRRWETMTMEERRLAFMGPVNPVPAGPAGAEEAAAAMPVSSA